MSKIRMRARFDYLGKNSSKRLFRGKNCIEAAEEIRQQKASLCRNVPIQGVKIEEIDMNMEVYTINEEATDKVIAFAPLSVTFIADSIEDAIRFTMKEEFRKIEILEPETFALPAIEVERTILRINEELMRFKYNLERRQNNWK